MTATIGTQQTIRDAKSNLTGAFGAYVGRSQKAAIGTILRGEEREWMAETINELAERVAKMPEIYGQDGLGDKAIAYLHYFKGNADWYITEKDTEGTEQAFGKADLGYGGELGYISITELVENGVELDLHFTPKPLAECR